MVTARRALLKRLAQNFRRHAVLPVLPLSDSWLAGCPGRLAARVLRDLLVFLAFPSGRIPRWSV